MSPNPHDQRRPAEPPSPATGSGGAVAIVLVVVLLAFVFPLVMSNRSVRSAGAWDEQAYHLPTIEQFARQWPHPIFSDYPSATTPGYHLILAAIYHVVGPHLQTLRLFGGAFTVGLIATLAWAASWSRKDEPLHSLSPVLRGEGRGEGTGAGAQVKGARVISAERAPHPNPLPWVQGRGDHLGITESCSWMMNPLTAVAICLPVICTPYVISSAVLLLPDNAGWWGVLAMLLIAFRRRVDAWTFLAGGLLLAALVLVRQIHLWVVAPFVVAAWWGSFEGILPRDGPEFRRRCLRVVAACFAVLPAVLALLGLFALWHGALPPSARGMNGGANPASPAMALAVLGETGVFFAGFLVPRLLERPRKFSIILIGLLLAAAAALIPHTDYNVAAGRWSGLWNYADRFPVWAHRSLLIVNLAVLGGAVAAACFVSLPRQDGWIFLATVIAFLVAQSATHMAFQRYYEPFWLMLLALVVSRARPSMEFRWKILGWAWIGPLLLALLLTAQTLRASG